MDRYLSILILPLLLILLSTTAQAGISLGKGAITLSAGQTTEMCDVWVYATQDGGRYTVETTGDLVPLTVSIEPNNFELDSIDCPEDPSARRLCIAEECMSENSESCKIVCLKFSAPMLMNWNTEKVKYEGSILNSIKIGAATIKEPYLFAVYVEPANIAPVITAAAAAVIIIIIFILLFLWRRRKR